MVYLEDAPSLEAALQQHFQNEAVDLLNPRKEFFRVTMERIEELFKARDLTVQLAKLAEAKDFRQTLALRGKTAAPAAQPTRSIEPVLPAGI